MNCNNLLPVYNYQFSSNNKLQLSQNKKQCNIVLSQLLIEEVDDCPDVMKVGFVEAEKIVAGQKKHSFPALGLVWVMY